MVWIFETKVTWSKLSTQYTHEHNLHTGWIQVKHQYGLNFLKSNMLKTHSTLDMHEHNLQASWIQVKHQYGLNFERKVTCSKLIVHRVCMSTCNLQTGWIQVKHQYFWNKNNMLKTHSTQSMHEHNLQTGCIQVKHQCSIYFWTKNNMLKIHSTQGRPWHIMLKNWSIMLCSYALKIMLLCFLVSIIMLSIMLM